ncbi:MAG: TetR/AcrR family transcriptional regulator [Caldilineaceae bacterium]|nr:TetR/AcrR family transcriptional regulator [Caldilineaceae bacterium]
MPPKGQLTREHIIAKAAVIFNTKGFAAASMADVMQATGLQKGGLYNHFDTKDELLLAAFDYALDKVTQAVLQVIKREQNSTQKLIALINFFRGYALTPIIEGGCPVLNGMVEADNVNPALQTRVRRAQQDLIGAVTRVIENGVRYGEFQPTINAEKSAIIMISMLEGAVGLTRTSRSQQYMDVVCDQLLRFVDGELRLPANPNMSLCEANVS